jgi:iron complex outermembrane receptor protein
VAGRSTTGSKTDTPITAIPQSVSVIGRDELDDRKVVKVDEALLYTAGVSAQSFGPDPDTDWFFIRGFQATQTGVFLDGLPLYSYGFGGFQIDPFLLERVEVLKGPASVLYGGSNPGGIINLVSKRPQKVPFGYIETGINNWGNAYLGFDYNNVDSTGAWSYRFTGRVAGGNQYTDFSEDLRGVIAPQITYHASAATKFTLYGIYAALDQVHVGGGFLPYVGTVVNAPFGKINRQAFYGEPSIDNQDRTQLLLGYEFEHAFDTWKIYQNARFGHMTGSQIGPYGFGYYSAVDAPFGNRLDPVPPGNLLYRIGFQEKSNVDTFVIDNRAIRTFETGFLGHSLMLGLDYKYFNIDHVQASGGATPISITNPVYGAPQGPASVYLDQDLTQHQIGIYAQDQVRFGDGWLVTLNGRYDYVDAKSVSAPGLAFSPTYNTDDSALSGRAGLAYEFANGLTPYVSAATFFNPIFDANPAVGAGPAEPFKPEEGYQFEAGIKYKPAFMDALVTASVFQIVKENVLNPAPTAANPFGQQQLGEVTSTGFEIEGKANITENLKVLATFTAFDLETTKDTRPTYVDKTPIIVPEVTASLWVDYTISEGAFKGLGLGGGMRYMGSSWVDPENTLKVPAATVLDAALRYQRDNWGVALNVANLLDENYVKSCQGYSGCGYGESRTVTLSAHVKW